EGEPVGLVDVDGVGVRAFLVAEDALALVLMDGRRFGERAVLLDWNGRATAAAVVRSQDGLAVAIDDEMARAAAARGLRVEQGERARLGVNGVGDDAALVDFT